MSGVLAVVWWIVGAMFAVGALFALIRMVKGPTIVDRMVASDALLTIAICVLGAEMVANGHTTNLPLMLALAMTAFIASVAVARYVSRQQRQDGEGGLDRGAATDGRDGAESGEGRA